MWEVLLDAILDTLKLVPFLLLIYVLIEILEHRTSITRNDKILQGRLAPLIGAATGLIPQCGFSVMAAKLYEEKLIRTGTLLAVFVATSDEAVIILLSSISAAGSVMPLVLIKLAAAVIVGYTANMLLFREKLVSANAPQSVSACGIEHKHDSDIYIFFISPLLHALKITLYLFIVNLAFGTLIYFVGEDKISAATAVGGAAGQPFITALVGLIPNCASSVILTGAYTNGGILFGSFVGGLCSNAGLGLVVLLKNTKKVKRNLLFVLALYLVAAATGLIVNGFMALFNL